MAASMASFLFSFSRLLAGRRLRRISVLLASTLSDLGDFDCSGGGEVEADNDGRGGKKSIQERFGSRGWIIECECKERKHCEIDDQDRTSNRKPDIAVLEAASLAPELPANIQEAYEAHQSNGQDRERVEE